MKAAAAAPDLPFVRRLEAIGFRSWPAAQTTFDGSWALRLTPSHPSRRLNSVNPLDPGDTARLRERIERAVERMALFGRRPCFRLSPLAPPVLDARLDALGWERGGETATLAGALDAMDLRPGTDIVPLRDTARWLDAAAAVGAFAPVLRPGMAEIVTAIRPQATGAGAAGEGPVRMYLAEDPDGTPLAVCLAVQFGTLVGLFAIATAAERRREGHARRLVASALVAARRNGATQCWLQVERANRAAAALYERLGMAERYGYHYRVAPPAGSPNGNAPNGDVPNGDAPNGDPA